MPAARTFVDVLREHASSARATHGFTFLRDGETDAVSLDYFGLDQRARALAARLASVSASDERVLLVLDPGLDYIVAFFGCLYAGAIAVPLYPPDPLKPAAGLEHLVRVARDAGARFALSSGSAPLLTAAADTPTLTWIDVAAVETSLSASWRAPSLDSGDIALLQYTSGSTSAPKGVRVTHANLLANAAFIRKAFAVTEDSRGVCWLPPFHDMGLIAGILEPLYLGADTALMSPQAFLQRPLRWLAAISRYRATTCGGATFAYDLVARRVPESAKADLDLSSWSVAFCGAEAVRAQTLDAFCAAFEPCGFRRSALLPCYGLAEATLLVASSPASTPPVVTEVDSRRFVSCGAPPDGVSIVIVEPETQSRLDDGSVGEIWIRGPGVADGYWGDPIETQTAFAARLDDGSGPYLRSGDLGFLRDAELYVTGRLKERIVVRGRTLYPQDVEATVEAADASVRPGRVAAFSVEENGDERLVVTCEVSRRSKQPAEDVVEAIRSAVAREHGVAPLAVVLLQPGELPRTTSGKPRRVECRARYVAARAHRSAASE